MSTDEVFGDVPSPKLCTEEEMLLPRNPYSASKASAEMYCNAYHYSYDLDIVIARSMNNFGPRQHPEKLIGKIITRCLTETPFTLFQGGSTRGWIYVKDTCRALKQIVNNGKSGEVYHIPPTAYRTVEEVMQTVLDITGKHHLFQGYKGTRLKDDERYALSGDKMMTELDWKPQEIFSDAMKKTIDWFSYNRWFWQHVESP